MSDGGLIVHFHYHQPLLADGSQPIVPTCTMSTDASNSGWGGARSAGPIVTGHWSEQESQMHINFLELKAIKFCILSFLHFLRNKTVRILSDNISAIFYLQKMGGTHSPMIVNWPSVFGRSYLTIIFLSPLFTFQALITLWLIFVLESISIIMIMPCVQMVLNY